MSPSLDTTTPSTSHTISHLATLQPPSNSRTWQSAPHPTQPLVATACADRTVRVYSLTSFTLLHTLSGGHKRSVRTVSWKPHTDGQSQHVLATGSFDASAGVWRHDYSSSNTTDFTSKLSRTNLEDSGSDDEGDNDENDAEDYQFTCLLDGHESELKCLSWSPSGQYLATCSRDKSVWIWEEIEDDNFETVAVLSEHEGDVKCVSWHPEEEVLASASYDDSVRLYRDDGDDWQQVAQIGPGAGDEEGGGRAGHAATVWWCEFEPSLSTVSAVDFRREKEGTGLSHPQNIYIEDLERSGPRLATCSDDRTIRIWRRKPREQAPNSTSGVPSIILSFSIDEEWLPDAILPRNHERAIYSVSWSKRTGYIVSAGSDGKIVVYKERWKAQHKPLNGNGAGNGEFAAVDHAAEALAAAAQEEGEQMTEWVVVAEIYSAHDVFEINHVCWAKRADKGRRSEEEEVIVSTGDDGEVRVWTLDEKA